MIDAFSGQIKHLSDAPHQVQLGCRPGSRNVVAETVEAFENDRVVVQRRQVDVVATSAPFFEVSDGKEAFPGCDVEYRLARFQSDEACDHLRRDRLEGRVKLNKMGYIFIKF